MLIIKVSFPNSVHFDDVADGSGIRVAEARCLFIERQAPIVTWYQESSPNNQLWHFLFAFLPYFPFLSSGSSIIVSNHLWRQHIIDLHSCLCSVGPLSQVLVLLAKSINILASLISLHSDFCLTSFIILFHFDLNFLIK